MFMHRCDANHVGGDFHAGAGGPFKPARVADIVANRVGGRNELTARNAVGTVLVCGEDGTAQATCNEAGGECTKHLARPLRLDHVTKTCGDALIDDRRGVRDRAGRARCPAGGAGPQRFEHGQHILAQPRARRGAIVVRRVMPRLDTRGAAHVDQFVLPMPQQRPEQSTPPAQRPRRPHTLQAVEIGAARQRREHRLELIIGVVRGGDPSGAEPRRGGVQGCVAQVARGGAKAAPARTGIHVFHNDRHIESPAETYDECLVFIGGVAQMVVHMHDRWRHQVAAVPQHHRRQQQGRRVGASADAQHPGRSRRGLVTPLKPSQQSVHEGVAPRLQPDPALSR